MCAAAPLVPRVPSDVHFGGAVPRSEGLVHGWVWPVSMRSGLVRGQQRHIRARIEAWRAQQKQKQTVRAFVRVRECVCPCA